MSANSNVFQFIRSVLPASAKRLDVNLCLIGYCLTVGLPSLNGFAGFVGGVGLHLSLLVPGVLVMLYGVRKFSNDTNVALIVPAACILSLVCSLLAFGAHYFINWFFWLLAN